MNGDRPVEAKRSAIATWTRRLAVPIIVGWIAAVAILNTAIPQLELVGTMRSVQMSPDFAPSVTAMKRVGHVFGEYRSDSTAMIVLESKQPLGADAHRYYDSIVARLEAAKNHVEYVQDFWGDPLAASGAQSNDGKAAYVQLYLVGNQGETAANESLDAVRKVVGAIPPPPGVTAYVSGPAALAADEQEAGDRSAVIIVGLTFIVITTTLLLVYRSIGTVLIVLGMVLVGLAAARGVVASLAYFHFVGLTTFVTNLLVTLAIAASTDYAIFLVGRYQEARASGQDRHAAYYTMFRGTAHVILASGSTIAGATLCLHFTRLPYFHTLGVPLAVGMVVAVAAALTLGPAAITVASRWGLLEPKRAMRIRGRRKIGALVARWPVPVLIASCGVTLIGLLSLVGYRTNYNERRYLPPDLPSVAGYTAAERHFSSARLNPEVLLIETDRDVRNPVDFMVIDKIAKKIGDQPGINRVQTITRPDGMPLKFSTVPAQLSLAGSVQTLNQSYLQDRMKDVLAQADLIQGSIDALMRMQALMSEMTANTHDIAGKSRQMASDVKELRDHIADFDDSFRPVRNYLYWEPHCYSIPVCWSLHSVFDALDSTNQLTSDIDGLLPNLERIDVLMPQFVQQLPAQIETLKQMKAMMLTMYATQNGFLQQLAAMQSGQAAMGEAFNESRNDETFYLPPEAFGNDDLKRGMKFFISPDGHAVRFVISLDDDPLTPEGLQRIDTIADAAKLAMKRTPLEGSAVYVGGTASVFKDMQEGNDYDLLIAGIAALCLIFVIMLIITRSAVAATVIVGTVVASLGASFGLSMLVWQYLIGIELHFMVMAMSLIILLAVGADYNLLLVARFREELHAGVKTGIIRAMGGTGSVVTSAGLVFAFTMMSMAASELKVVAQIGTTIALGLLFDTLVIRAFMTPAMAVLLGKWFWWPQAVRPRPIPALWPKPDDVVRDSDAPVSDWESAELDEVRRGAQPAQHGEPV
ncbi:RND family transporter [Mycobacterium sp. CVI_P3]|uniref:RND family transporter n=1 Tax=Mycobacterium pinniadriaticum TaxID=2994102 RepID=A0ABT3SK19_9MYCO|nr:RND family transporter [Mycobacterium pinniadriaticum]MCX2933414.1 RND family transporter [Mycobacterium pinniadriaticum]MCX2939836.1 RND family transporter [Mycobacterium pinniadriaticum]